MTLNILLRGGQARNNRAVTGTIRCACLGYPESWSVRNDDRETGDDGDARAASSAALDPSCEDSRIL